MDSKCFKFIVYGPSNEDTESKIIAFCVNACNAEDDDLFEGFADARHLGETCEYEVNVTVKKVRHWKQNIVENVS